MLFDFPMPNLRKLSIIRCAGLAYVHFHITPDMYSSLTHVTTETEVIISSRTKETEVLLPSLMFCYCPSFRDIPCGEKLHTTKSQLITLNMESLKQ